MSKIVVLGTFDTKGVEHQFLANEIKALGHQVILVDIGTSQNSKIAADYNAQQIFAIAGLPMPLPISDMDRSMAMQAMVEVLPLFLKELLITENYSGIISLGGGGGTSMATAGMRALPLGLPKIMVSTLSSGNTAHYIGTKDIVMIPSIVDIAGINKISRLVLKQSAAALCGMANIKMDDIPAKPTILISMFGNTNKCVASIQAQLELRGFEVLVFHATGKGGELMENIIASGIADGVLDITTTELADELVGGVLTAGPNRLNASGTQSTPTIISLGCLDMINFGESITVPKKFINRRFYQHNPQVTLMRTNLEESIQLGEIIAHKLNQYLTPPTLIIPLKGFSVIGTEGQPFYDREADLALINSLTINLNKNINVISLNCTINDEEFANGCIEAFFKIYPNPNLA